MTTLTDRYVWAVTHHLPDAQRDDIARELRATVADMVDGRDGPPEAAERAALTELGNPRRLASSYREGRRHLIGPAVYDVYITVLRATLSWVVPIIAILAGGGALIDEQSIVSAIGAAISGGLNVGVWVAVVVTVIFAAIDAYDPVPIAEARDAEGWSLDDLPEVPEPAASAVSTGEVVASTAVSILTIAALFWQRSRFPLTDGAGESIPFLDPQLWDDWMWVLIATLVASMLVVFTAWRVGRWTWPLAGLNAALNATFLGIVAWLALDERLLNPAALAAIAERAEWDQLTISPWAIIGVVALVQVMDTVDVCRKAWRSDHQPDVGLGLR